jgi:hypothetical protein
MDEVIVAPPRNGNLTDSAGGEPLADGLPKESSATSDGHTAAGKIERHERNPKNRSVVRQKKEFSQNTATRPVTSMADDDWQKTGNE